MKRLTVTIAVAVAGDAGGATTHAGFPVGCSPAWVDLETPRPRL